MPDSREIERPKLEGAAGARRSLVFAISADYERRTGGWVYDARLMQELRLLGWHVRDLLLPAGFPHPSAEARAASAAAFAALPDGTIVVADQLCLGVLPDVAKREAHRLRLAMIVHHPLMLERNGGADDVFARSERKALRHVRLAIVTSCETATWLGRMFEVPADRIVVAPPGTEPRPLAPGSGNPVPLLLSIGAVVPRKDHGTLIAALSGLRNMAWHLTIVGNTTRAPEHVAGIRARIDAAGLGDRITLTGELDEAALERAWARADAYVAASRHEGFGMAIAEAVSRGLPVMTTAAGAVAEWLSRDAALIVPTGDARTLGSAIGRYLSDPETRAALRRGSALQRQRLLRWSDTAARVDASLALMPGDQGMRC